MKVRAQIILFTYGPNPLPYAYDLLEDHILNMLNFNTKTFFSLRMKMCKQTSLLLNGFKGTDFGKTH